MKSLLQLPARPALLLALLLSGFNVQADAWTETQKTA